MKHKLLIGLSVIILLQVASVGAIDQYIEFSKKGTDYQASNTEYLNNTSYIRNGRYNFQETYIIRTIEYDFIYGNNYGREVLISSINGTYITINNKLLSVRLGDSEEKVQTKIKQGYNKLIVTANDKQTQLYLNNKLVDTINESNYLLEHNFTSYFINSNIINFCLSEYNLFDNISRDIKKDCYNPNHHNTNKKLTLKGLSESYNYGGLTLKDGSTLTMDNVNLDLTQEVNIFLSFDSIETYHDKLTMFAKLEGYITLSGYFDRNKLCFIIKSEDQDELCYKTRHVNQIAIKLNILDDTITIYDDNKIIDTIKDQNITYTNNDKKFTMYGNNNIEWLLLDIVNKNLTEEQIYNVNSLYSIKDIDKVVNTQPQEPTQTQTTTPTIKEPTKEPVKQKIINNTNNVKRYKDTDYKKVTIPEEESLFKRALKKIFPFFF